MWQISCVQKAFKQLEAQGERLEICVNNAGIAKMTPLFESDTQSDFEQIIKTNIMGVWYVAQTAAIRMQQHQIQGSIANFL